MDRVRGSALFRWNLPPIIDHIHLAVAGLAEGKSPEEVAAHVADAGPTACEVLKALERILPDQVKRGKRTVRNEEKIHVRTLLYRVCGEELHLAAVRAEEAGLEGYMADGGGGRGMSSAAPVYFCEPAALKKLVKAFSKAMQVEPVEVKPIELMRMARRGDEASSLLVVRGVSSLLRAEHVDREEAIIRLKGSLRRLSKMGSYVLVEVGRLSWDPSKTSQIEIEGVRFAVGGIDLSDTYGKAREYEVRPTQLVVAMV